MYIYHKCLDCGYIGEVKKINNTVTCPQCSIVSDVWFDGEEPPINHINYNLYDQYLTDAEQSNVVDALTFEEWIKSK